MKILFTTSQTTSDSTELNVPNYRRLGEIDGVEIDFFNNNYADYDVVLFMGYDPDVRGARKANPNIKIGVIDTRPGLIKLARGADFLIVNGPEQSSYFTRRLLSYFLSANVNMMNSIRQTWERR